MTEKSQILVTGGAGYIGSHSVLALCEAGYEPIVVDNLENSSHESLKRVESIVGRSIKFYQLDIRDYQKLKDV
ncbi:MAG: SDR family NAD(P)-dependent oxidoreductase, partial [Limisphaerales bacterium]